MKIVVLAGGLSDERNVSLSSGCKVCAALRERGHQAALIDMYLGTDQPPEAHRLFPPLPAGGFLPAHRPAAVLPGHGNLI